MKGLAKVPEVEVIVEVAVPIKATVAFIFKLQVVIVWRVIVRGSGRHHGGARFLF